MTTAHAGTRGDGMRSRLWLRVLAWAVGEDNARLDFKVIGVLNGAMAAVLGVVPQLAHSPSLTALMRALPRAVWVVAFAAVAVLVFASLRCAPAWSGRLRHYAWLLAGTLLVMWITGVLWSTGSLTSVILLVGLLVWYTLTAARLELPRYLGLR